MRVSCDDCGGEFDANDVLIDHGEMACPHCATLIDLDAALSADRGNEEVALWQGSPGEAPAAPLWMQACETGDVIEFRWSRHSHNGRDRWTMTLIALGLLAGTIWCFLFGWSTATNAYDRIAPFLLIPLVLLAGGISLAMWLNTTVVRMTADAVSMRCGPIPLTKRSVEVETKRVVYFWCKNWASEDSTGVHAFSCATQDGELVRIVESVPDRQGAYFLKDRLNRFLEAVRSKGRM